MKKNKSNFCSKNIVITGGSEGLGLKIAEEFILNGSNVLICGRSTDKLKVAEDFLKTRSKKNQIIKSQKCDVSDFRENSDFAKIAYDTFGGRVDSLINNAASLGKIGLASKSEINIWRILFEINFFGIIDVTNKFLSMLEKSPYAHIVNIGSSSAFSPDPLFCPYASTKSALLGYTLTIAEELRLKNISVNYLMPGGLGTAMNDEKIKAGNELLGDELHKTFIKRKKQGDKKIKKTAEFIYKLCLIKSNYLTGRILSAQHDDLRLFEDRSEELAEKFILKRT